MTNARSRLTRPDGERNGRARDVGLSESDARATNIPYRLLRDFSLREFTDNVAMRFTRCVWPTVAVLAVGSATLAALAGASYSIGRGTTENAPELRFLDRRRPPTADEACLTFLGEYSLRLA